MSDSIHSAAWYRCAELKPKLRSHARIHRHEYRDELWYVLEDPSSGRHHRFTPAAYRLLGLMDGSRSVARIWERALEQMGDEAPSQGELIQLLAQLHSADVLQADVSPDVEDLFTRFKQHRKVRWKQSFSNPLAIRIPLLDPERFLTRWLPVVRPLVGWFGGTVWLVVVVVALMLLPAHWRDLTENVTDRALSVQNLFVLWLVYPLVKGVHELGHAFATKRWGGEVHEIGVMLLVLVPVPYVEASAASAFRDKYQRMVVGAAGILVEVLLAALALILWINVEPGIVRTMAYNVMLIGGVSTLFFNGNPLLRFDGYYVLADALEIPNLATRSKNYLTYLFQRYLCGVEDARSPSTDRGERAWLLFYGLASFAYRMFIMFFIILLVAGQYFVIGVLLALWAVANQVVVPLAKNIAFLFTSPRLRRNRARSVSVTTVLVSALAGVLFALPLPSATRSEGVVWLPVQSQVRAGVDGSIVRLLAEDGARVERGDPLIEIEDPLLQMQVAIIEARVREIEARLTEVQFLDRTRAQVIRQEREAVIADLDRAGERLAGLILRAPVGGTFVVPGAADLPGRFVRRGNLVGYVTDTSTTTVRVVVDQDSIGLVRNRTGGVQAKLADWGAAPVDAEILREVPGASDQLPARALGSSGGGRFATDPRDPAGLKTLENVFQLDLALPDRVRIEHLGGRVQVRFDHGKEPMGLQWYRALRQLFLSHFGV